MGGSEELVQGWEGNGVAEGEAATCPPLPILPPQWPAGPALWEARDEGKEWRPTNRPLCYPTIAESLI